MEHSTVKDCKLLVSEPKIWTGVWQGTAVENNTRPVRIRSITLGHSWPALFFSFKHKAKCKITGPGHGQKQRDSLPTKTPSGNQDGAHPPSLKSQWAPMWNFKAAAGEIGRGWIRRAYDSFSVDYDFMLEYSHGVKTSVHLWRNLPIGSMHAELICFHGESQSSILLLCIQWIFVVSSWRRLYTGVIR